MGRAVLARARRVRVVAELDEPRRVAAHEIRRLARVADAEDHPRQAGCGERGTYDIPFARAKRSRRYQRSLLPPRSADDPERRRDGDAGDDEERARSEQRRTATAAPTPERDHRADDRDERRAEHEHHDDDHHDVTITAMPPNADGTRPSCRSCRANAVTAVRSTGSVSGRGSKGTDAVGPGAAHRFTSSASHVRSAPSRIGSASSRGSAHERADQLGGAADDGRVVVDLGDEHPRAVVGPDEARAVRGRREAVVLELAVAPRRTRVPSRGRRAPTLRRGTARGRDSAGSAAARERSHPRGCRAATTACGRRR